MTKRTRAKQTLRKIGQKTEGKYCKEFTDFLDAKKLREDNFGILFEYALAYILGVFQSEYRGYFEIKMTDYLDDVEKVDFLINGHRIQVKINWDESKLPMDKAGQYEYFSTQLLTFHSKDSDGNNTCGIDVIREILAACGFSEEFIENHIDNPAFDAAEEILSDWLFN